ncbi:hypothetical protein J6590_061235 [Homalodisca vitripennis]|nr:hypothetical protein J6590_061235 [Homalodisca vitripennis]
MRLNDTKNVQRQKQVLLDCDVTVGVLLRRDLVELVLTRCDYCACACEGDLAPLPAAVPRQAMPLTHGM